MALLDLVQMVLVSKRVRVVPEEEIVPHGLELMMR
jgi:hypothetical protein